MRIDEPSFKQFYDTNLFSIIHSSLGTKANYKTKTVCVGMYPSVAEYNGFWTLDAYRVNYPAEYKALFRCVIEPEIEKNEIIRKNYDEWGSRCYVYSSELTNLNKPFLIGKESNIRIDELDINTDALKRLGCDYILSAAEICNLSQLNISLVEEYSTNDSFWRIRVYKLL